MARPKRTMPAKEKTICLSLDLVAKIDLFLYSEVEGKVPFGAWQKYLETLIRADIAAREKLHAQG